MGIDIACGRLGRSNRIRRVMNGVEAKAGEYPWIVHITLPTVSKPFGGCVGSIISPYWVITAAHCFEKR